MKTIKRVLFFSSFLLLLTSSSCETNDKETGDVRFSCYINGQLFVPKGSTNLVSTSPNNDGFSIYLYDDFISLKVSNSSDFVYFSITNYKIGKIDLDNSLGFSGPSDSHTMNHAVVKFNNKTYLSRDNSGSVTFTEVSDTNVEGTFEFTLYNENDDSDTIRVTSGKFND
jgi:hypothetical protein